MISKTDLLDILKVRFDLGELRTLCFNLGVSYDDLPGDSITDKARGLIQFYDRRRKLPQLLKAIRELRPDIIINEADAPIKNDDSWPPNPRRGGLSSRAKVALIGFIFVVVAAIIVVVAPPILAPPPTPLPRPTSRATATPPASPISPAPSVSGVGAAPTLHTSIPTPLHTVMVIPTPIVTASRTPTLTPMPDMTMGPVGGGGGIDFYDVVPAGAKVIALQIRSGTRINSIEVSLDNGRSFKHGENKGSLQEPIQLAEGEYITRISGRYGAKIDQIAIQTNKRIYGPYGGGGGGPFSFPAPAGFQIVGFFGRSGEEVDALGVIVRQIR